MLHRCGSKTTVSEVASLVAQRAELATLRSRCSLSSKLTTWIVPTATAHNGAVLREGEDGVEQTQTQESGAGEELAIRLL